MKIQRISYQGDRITVTGKTTTKTYSLRTELAKAANGKPSRLDNHILLSAAYLALK